MRRIKKKLGALLLSVLLILSLAACGSSGETSNYSTESAAATDQQDSALEATTPQKETESEQEQRADSIPDDTTSNEIVSGSDVLVVYFSRTGEQYTVGVIDKGNTAIVAEMIIERTGADSFEILPEEDYYPYTYSELTDVAKREQNENARPGYAGEVPDLTQYSTVFIGAPVWWGDWPMICYTFFENNADALAGKTLIPFSTHEGSGLSGFDRKLSSVCPDSTVGEGLAIRGNDAQNNQDSVRSKVNDWLSGLGY